MLWLTWYIHAEGFVFHYSYNNFISNVLFERKKRKITSISIIITLQQIFISSNVLTSEKQILPVVRISGNCNLIGHVGHICNYNHILILSNRCTKE